MGLDDEKGHQDLRPRGPSSMLPLSSVIKDAFDKFEHDFQAANLTEGKYIEPPPSTTKWYYVGQPSQQTHNVRLTLFYSCKYVADVVNFETTLSQLLGIRIPCVTW